MINITLIDASTIDLTTKVNIALSTLSVLLVIISVVTVIITLRQNQKMIENSSRPYITLHIGILQCSTITPYFIFKNFGQSAAIITSFSCNRDLSECALRKDCIPFEGIIGSTICPGQSMLYAINLKDIKNNDLPFVFDFSYTANSKSYAEHIVISPQAYKHEVHARVSTKGEEIRTISYAIQDIAEKLLNL